MGRGGNEAAEAAAKLAEGGIPCLGVAVAPAGGSGANPSLAVEPRSPGYAASAAGEAAGEALEDPPRPDDVALFLHTSGTTSRPKGVPLSHANLAASLENIKQVGGWGGVRWVVGVKVRWGGGWGVGGLHGGTGGSGTEVARPLGVFLGLVSSQGHDPPNPGLHAGDVALPPPWSAHLTSPSLVRLFPT